jgi:hypothetical protein
MIVSGGIFKITFDNEETEHKVLTWANKGNTNIAYTPYAKLGIGFYFTQCGFRTYVMGITHNWFFNLAWVCRLGFWFMAKRIHKHYQIKNLSKIDLYNFYESKLKKV